MVSSMQLCRTLGILRSGRRCWLYGEKIYRHRRRVCAQLRPKVIAVATLLRIFESGRARSGSQALPRSPCFSISSILLLEL